MDAHYSDSFVHICFRFQKPCQVSVDQNVGAAFRNESKTPSAPGQYIGFTSVCPQWLRGFQAFVHSGLSFTFQIRVPRTFSELD